MTSISQMFYELRSNCKRKVNETVLNADENSEFCDIIWDGIMCWPKTPVGTERALPCPEYFGFSPKNVATKKCMDNGKWFVNETLNTIWTNYSQCEMLYGPDTGKLNISETFEDLTFISWWFPKIKTLNHICYGISLTTLMIALTIFLCIKKLRCARNRLHMHIFLAFILKASVILLKDFLFVDGIAMANDVHIDGKDRYIKEHNFWICKAIISALQYFTITTYILILMEGIYLHNLLFSNLLFSHKNNIIFYTLFGWGLPICFLIPWILLKVWYDDELCWTKTENPYFQLLIHTPLVLSTLINFVLFLKILNMLVLKLNSIYIQQLKLKYRRLIRSTLILVPLFGVPYIISISMWYYATINPTVEFIWIAFDQTFTSLQGFFVSFLYCLMNKEVQQELKRRLLPKRYWLPATLKADQSILMSTINRSNHINITINGNNDRRSTR